MTSQNPHCAGSNKSVARHPGLFNGAVRVHVEHLLNKLGLRSRVEAPVRMTNLKD